MRNESPSRQRANNMWRMRLLVIAAFTPYLGTVLALRVEHLIIYGLLLLVLVDPKGLERALAASARLLVPWFLLAALVVANVMVRLTNEGRLTDLDAAARILALADSFLLQAVGMLLAIRWASLRPSASSRQVRAVAVAFISLMCANSLLVLLVDPATVDTLLRQFWTNPNPIGAGATIAANELTAGRYGGIFNQPFDGGLAYGYALLVWWYLFAGRLERTVRTAVLPTIGLGLILAGGLSTGSKVFLAGILLLAGQVVLGRTGRIGRTLPRNVGLLAIAGVGVSALVWLERADFRRFQAFVGAIGRDTGSLTGGRFRSIAEWWGQILNDVSILGSQNFYTDDAFRAYLTGGGIVGLVLVGLVYRELFGVAARLPIRSAERNLAFGLTLMTLGASFGSVSLQTSRASTIYWVLMGGLLAHARNLRAARSSTRVGQQESHASAR